jgi:hypothetical protein
MAGITGTSWRIRARCARFATVVLVAALATICAPATASAAPPGTIRGFVDCFTYNRDGSLTLVVGYENTWGRKVTIPHGKRNRLVPAGIGGTSPTRFAAGTVHGAFQVQVTPLQLGARPRWEIDGGVLDYRGVEHHSSTCPSGTPLPGGGNGWGWAMGLGGAAVVGALAVGLESRRRRATADGVGA